MATKRSSKAVKGTKSRSKRIPSVKKLEHVQNLMMAECGPKTGIWVTTLK